MIESPPSTAAASPGRRRLLAPLGRFFFKFRDLLFPVVFFGLALASYPRLFLGSERWDRALDALGIAVALSGQLLRAAVIGLAYIRRGGKDKQVFADSLVQEGIFAHSRNPLYLGNFLALAGFCLIHNSTLCYAVGVPFFALAYLAIVAAEEEYLQQKFGAEYEAYCRRVPRFIPAFRGLRATLGEMEFDWKRLIRKEYGSTFAGACCILALLVWDEYVRHGGAGAASALAAAAWIWVPLAAAYLVARYLKKSGALGTG
ncbi:MAG TPA: isoprenylcysteine carboxylmethyltransferase family protein [Thermoanaerobaculia bacterium]